MIPEEFAAPCFSGPPRDNQTYATIHDLPTENLIRIFYAATEFRYSNVTLAGATKTLLSLTRVSRYWRAAVISITRVWGRLINVIDLSDSQILCFIERSKSSPIEVFLDGDSLSLAKLPGSHERFSRVLLELHRISYLVMRHFHLSETHFDRMRCSAPSMDLFSFEGPGSDPVRLPVPLFNNHTPRLRSLRLSSALIDLDQTSYPSLEELSVRNIRHPFAPAVSEWLTFLSKHTLLASLNLTYATSVRFSPSSEWMPVIDMPCLQELVLADEVTSCAHLLDKITPPTSCRTSVVAGLEPDGGDGVQLLQAVCSSLVARRISTYLQITLSGTSVAFTNRNNDPASCLQTSHIFLKFQWQANFDPFEESQLPHNAIDFLPASVLASIENLRIVLSPINGRYPFDDASLLSIFNDWIWRLTSVEHLILESCSLDTLLSLLSNDGDGDNYNENDGEGNNLHCPRLASLRGLEVLQAEGEEVNWGALVSFAEWRIDAQRGINYIMVPSSEVDHLSREDASLLGDLDVEICLK